MPYKTDGIAFWTGILLGVFFLALLAFVLMFLLMKILVWLIVLTV